MAQQGTIRPHPTFGDGSQSLPRGGKEIPIPSPLTPKGDKRHALGFLGKTNTAIPSTTTPARAETKTPTCLPLVERRARRKKKSNHARRSPSIKRAISYDLLDKSPEALIFEPSQVSLKSQVKEQYRIKRGGCLRNEVELLSALDAGAAEIAKQGQDMEVCKAKIAPRDQSESLKKEIAKLKQYLSYW
ncbi:hypothetical protein ACFE04_019191 [Oxalis oulophora]